MENRQMIHSYKEQNFFPFCLLPELLNYITWAWDCLSVTILAKNSFSLLHCLLSDRKTEIEILCSISNWQHTINDLILGNSLRWSKSNIVQKLIFLCENRIFGAVLMRFNLIKSIWWRNFAKFDEILKNFPNSYVNCVAEEK